MPHPANRLRANGLRSELPSLLPNEPTSTVDLVGFESLPAIDYATNGTFAVLLIDPEGDNGDVEIAYVEVHAAAVATVSLRRGVEGTAPREHPAGTKVVIGPTAADFGTNPQRVYDHIDFENSYVAGGAQIVTGPSWDMGSAVMAVGAGAKAASYTVALGAGAEGLDDESVVVGAYARATRATDVAIGSFAVADSQSINYDGAVAIGTGAAATGDLTTTVGAHSQAQNGGLALGAGSWASALQSVAIGTYNTTAFHQGAVAIGEGANSENPFDFILGWRNHTVLMQGGLRFAPLYRDGDYAIDTTNKDLVVIANAELASSTITLPTSPSVGRVIVVKRRDEVNLNTLTVAPETGGTIDGSANIALAPMESVWLTYVGTGQWFII